MSKISGRDKTPREEIFGVSSRCEKRALTEDSTTASAGPFLEVDGDGDLLLPDEESELPTCRSIELARDRRKVGLGARIEAILTFRRQTHSRTKQIVLWRTPKYS